MESARFWKRSEVHHGRSRISVIYWEQSMAMVSSLLKGDPDSGAVVRNCFKGVVAEYLPG
jgi:hypothetical protein